MGINDKRHPQQHGENFQAAVQQKLFANINKVLGVFQEFDEEGKGTLSRDEFLLGIELLGIDVKDKRLKVLIERYSDDGGRVNFVKLLNAMQSSAATDQKRSTPAPPPRTTSTSPGGRPKAKPLPQSTTPSRPTATTPSANRGAAVDRLASKGPKAVQVFRKFDNNKSGCITPYQLALGLQELNLQLTEGGVPKLVKAAKLTDQGNVKYMEFVRDVFHYTPADGGAVGGGNNAPSSSTSRADGGVGAGGAGNDRQGDISEMEAYIHELEQALKQASDANQVLEGKLRSTLSQSNRWEKSESTAESESKVAMIQSLQSRLQQSQSKLNQLTQLKQEAEKRFESEMQSAQQTLDQYEKRMKELEDARGPSTTDSESLRREIDQLTTKVRVLERKNKDFEAEVSKKAELLRKKEAEISKRDDRWVTLQSVVAKGGVSSKLKTDALLQILVDIEKDEFHPTPDLPNTLFDNSNNSDAMTTIRALESQLNTLQHELIGDKEEYERKARYQEKHLKMLEDKLVEKDMLLKEKQRESGESSPARMASPSPTPISPVTPSSPPMSPSANVKRRLELLEAELEDNKDRMEKEREIMKQDKQSLLDRIVDLQSERDRIQAEISKVEHEKDILQSQLDAAEATIQQYKHQLNNATTVPASPPAPFSPGYDERASSPPRSPGGLMQQVSIMEKDNQTLLAEMAALQERAAAERHTLLERISELQRNPEEGGSGGASTNTEILSLKYQLSETKKELEDLMASSIPHNEQEQDLKKQLVEARAEIVSLKRKTDEVPVLQRALGESEGTVSAISKELQDSNHRITNLTRQLEDLQKEQQLRSTKELRDAQVSPRASPAPSAGVESPTRLEKALAEADMERAQLGQQVKRLEAKLTAISREGGTETGWKIRATRAEEELTIVKEKYERALAESRRIRDTLVDRIALIQEDVGNLGGIPDKRTLRDSLEDSVENDKKEDGEGREGDEDGEKKETEGESPKAKVVTSGNDEEEKSSPPKEVSPEDMDEEKISLIDRIESLTEEIAASNEALSASVIQSDEGRRERDKLRFDLSTAEETIRELHRDKALLETELNRIAQSGDDLRATLDAQLAEAHKQNERYREEISKLHTQARVSASPVARRSPDLSSSPDQTREDLRKECAKLQEDRASLLEQMSRESVELSNCQEELLALQKRSKDLEENLRRVRIEKQQSELDMNDRMQKYVDEKNAVILNLQKEKERLVIDIAASTKHITSSPSASPSRSPLSSRRSPQRERTEVDTQTTPPRIPPSPVPSTSPFLHTSQQSLSGESIRKDDVASLTAICSDLRQERDQLSTQLKETKEKLDDAMEGKKTLHESVDYLERMMERSKRQLEKETEGFQTAIREKERQIRSMELELTTRLRAKDVQAQELLDEVDGRRQQLESVIVSGDRALREASELEKGELVVASHNLAADNATLVGDNASLAAENTLLQDRISSIDHEVAALHRERAALEAHVSGQSQTIGQLEATIASLSSEIAHLRSVAEMANVRVMQQQEQMMMEQQLQQQPQPQPERVTQVVISPTTGRELDIGSVVTPAPPQPPSSTDTYRSSAHPEYAHQMVGSAIAPSVSPSHPASVRGVESASRAELEREVETLQKELVVANEEKRLLVARLQELEAQVAKCHDDNLSTIANCQSDKNFLMKEMHDMEESLRSVTRERDSFKKVIHALERETRGYKEGSGSVARDLAEQQVRDVMEKQMMAKYTKTLEKKLSDITDVQQSMSAYRVQPITPMPAHSIPLNESLETETSIASSHTTKSARHPSYLEPQNIIPNASTPVHPRSQSPEQSTASVQEEFMKLKQRLATEMDDTDGNKKSRPVAPSGNVFESQQPMPAVNANRGGEEELPDDNDPGFKRELDRIQEIHKAAESQDEQQQRLREQLNQYTNQFEEMTQVMFGGRVGGGGGSQTLVDASPINHSNSPGLSSTAPTNINSSVQSLSPRSTTSPPPRERVNVNKDPKAISYLDALNALDQNIAQLQSERKEFTEKALQVRH